MQLFLSYPSAERPLAERLLLALEAEGHQVFMDRHDLPAGQSFHQPLREAIEAADAMVVLVTPAAVAPGSYVLAELEIARQHWRRPSGRVLPVLVQPTPIASLPPWLSAVTVLQPRGEPVAETVAAVARMRAGATGGRGWRIAVSAAVALVLGVGGWQLAERRAAEARQAEVAALQAQAAQLLPLCVDGQHAATLQQLGALAASAAQSAAASALQAAQQDCALRWLREMRATRGGPTPRSFAEQVAVVQPVLLQALATAQGQRAADLRAHLGWAAFLLAREGAAGGDPSALWQQALQDEPGNVYAHAMWGRALLPARLAEAQAHFEQALAAKRERAFVRTLQFGGALGAGADAAAYALQVADSMQRSGEVLAPELRLRLWNHAFGMRLLQPDDRAVLLAALPGPALLALFDALYPTAPGTGQDEIWQFDRALLQAQAGDRDGARDALQALAEDLVAAGQDGRLLAETEQALKTLNATSGAAR